MCKLIYLYLLFINIKYIIYYIHLRQRALLCKWIILEMLDTKWNVWISKRKHVVGKI